MYPGFRRRRSVTVLACFLFMALVKQKGGAEIIYDNSTNLQNQFITVPGEFGDEIAFGGSARVLSVIAFEVVGEANLGALARVRFRIYQNNGPIPPPPEPQFPSPGELLYQSNEITVRPGVQPIRIQDLAVAVPDRVTWTVEFFGTGPQVGQRAGLRLFHPAVIGRSFVDYWVRQPSGFRLYLLESGAPASFAAHFEALPDPPVLLRSLPPTNAVPRLQLAGPIGTRHVIETTGDLITWRDLGPANLLTNAVRIFDDPEGFGTAPKFYRARRIVTPPGGPSLR